MYCAFPVFISTPRGSRLSTCILVKQSWFLTFSNEAVCRLKVCLRSCRDFFLVRRHAQPIFNEPYISTGSLTSFAGYPMSRETYSRVPKYFAFGTTDATCARLLTQPWVTGIRRFRFSFGRPACLPVKHLTYRLLGSNCNLDYRDTQLPFGYPTNFTLTWCVSIKTAWATSAAKLSRSIKRYTRLDPELSICQRAYVPALPLQCFSLFVRHR